MSGINQVNSYEAMEEETIQLSKCVEDLSEELDGLRLPDDITDLLGLCKRASLNILRTQVPILKEKVMLFMWIETVDLNFTFQIGSESVEVHVTKKPDGAVEHDYNGEFYLNEAIRECVYEHLKKPITKINIEEPQHRIPVVATERAQEAFAVEIEKIAVEADHSPSHASKKINPPMTINIAMTNCSGNITLKSGVNIQIPMPENDDLYTETGQFQNKLRSLFNRMPTRRIQIPERQ